MSAAHSAASTARRLAPSPQTPRPAQRAARFADQDVEDRIRINLSDIPPLPPDSMDVEGLKPSLLSRLMDLIAPIRAR